MKSERVAWALLLSLVGSITCGGGTALDPSDPMTAPGDGDGGTVLRACALCFENSCAWQTVECASDPACARWLTCARDCGPGDDDTPSPSCLDSCEQPSALQSQRYRDALASCFQATGGCCSDANQTPDASAVDSGQVYDAAEAPYAPMACNAEGCKTCLLAMKDANPCVKDDAICPGLLSDCYFENAPNGPQHCWNFLVAYGQCSSGPSPTGSPCSYDVPAPSVGTTAGAMACAARHCPQCMPDPRGACVSCQLGSCPDEMRGLLQSAAAQNILWCRASCETSANATACKQACLDGHDDLIPTLSALLTCTQQACESSCAGLY